jgi:hypothetical protein
MVVNIIFRNSVTLRVTEVLDDRGVVCMVSLVLTRNMKYMRLECVLASCAHTDKYVNGEFIGVAPH